MTWIVLGLALAVGAVVLVALPVLREPVAADDRLDAPTDAQERRLLLVEERDRALAALKELEFDHRSGIVDDEDYRVLVGPLRQAAAVALRALDAELADEPQVGQVPVALPELEAVADEELVGDGEADVAHRQVVDEAAVGPVEQRRDVE